ncbi:MAG: hypothetical protein J6Y74_02800 [Clostridia bacterium]|nr:hypothetical protein [Clostridia bacterium]
MKKKKLTRIILLAIVICLAVAVTMALAACGGKNKPGESSGGGDTSSDTPVYSLSSRTSERLLVFSWENIPYRQLRLYDKRQNDVISVEAGMSYVTLPFTETCEYNLEYYEGGEWKVLQPIAFYKLNDIARASVAASITKDGLVTLSWEQTDNAKNPQYEIALQVDGAESFVSVSGASMTYDFEAGKLYKVRIRETVPLSYEDGKLNVAYSYWSDPIDFCKLGSVGQIEYDDKEESILISKVANSFGYVVTAYYGNELSRPAVRTTPKETPGGGQGKVKLAFPEISQLDSAFNLRVEPMGTDNVVDPDGRLYIAPADVAEVNVKMNAPITGLDVTGGAVTWNNIENCSYYLRGTTDGTPWSDRVDFTSEPMVLYEEGSNLRADTMVDLYVKPIYQTKNTFSRWASITGLYVLDAPVVSVNSNVGVNVSWSHLGGDTVYTVRQEKDGKAEFKSVDSKVLYVLGTEQNPLSSGTYRISVTGNDMKNYGSTIVCDGETTRKKGCLGKYSETKTILKLQKPSYRIRHVQGGAQYNDRDRIEIEIISDGSYSHSCTLGNDILPYVGNKYVLENSSAIQSRVTTIALRAEDSLMNGDFLAVPSDKVLVQIHKAENFSVSQNPLTVTSGSVAWKQPSNTYQYSVVFSKGTSTTPTDYVKTILTNEAHAYEYDAFLSNGSLLAGGYTFKVAYSYGYSVSDLEVMIDDEDAEEEMESDTELYLDGEYASLTFYKNATPNIREYSSNGRLSLGVGADGERLSCSYSLSTGTELLLDKSDTFINLKSNLASYSAGENVVHIVNAAMQTGYSATIASDPAIYRVTRLAAPELEIKDSYLHVKKSVDGATRYKIEVSGSSTYFSALQYALNNTIAKLAEAGTHTLTVTANCEDTTIPVFDSASAVITVVRLKKPTLAYASQVISMSDYGYAAGPAGVALALYKKTDNDPAEAEYALDESYVLAANQSRSLDLSDKTAQYALDGGAGRRVLDLAAAGYYKLVFRALGDGENTLDSTDVSTMIVRRQATPELSFRKPTADAFVDLSFSKAFTDKYTYSLDGAVLSREGSTATDLTYAVPSASLASGTHAFSAYLNNDDDGDGVKYDGQYIPYLPSAEQTVRFYKLVAPTITMNDSFALCWSVDDAANSDKYENYSYINKIPHASDRSDVTSATSLSAAYLAELASGEQGECTIYAVGTAEKLTLDSDKTVRTYVRSVTPTALTFVSAKGDVTDSSKLTWAHNDLTNGVYRYAFNAAIGGVHSVREAAFDPMLAAGTYVISVSELGDPAAFRLPSVPSESVTVTKLATVSNIVKNKDESLSWSEVSSAVTYIITAGDAYKADTADPSYNWKALQAGAYTLRVIARNEDGNYLDSVPSEAISVVKLATPALTLGASLSWTAVPSAFSYEVKIDSQTAGISEREYSLAGVAVGTHPVSVKAVGGVSGGTVYLDSEKASFNLTVAKLEKPTGLALDAEKMLRWNDVSNAFGYAVTMNDESQGNATSFDVSGLDVGEYNISVKALGGVSGYTLYRDSDASAEFELDVVKLDKPSLSQSGTTVTWTPVPHASGYKAKADNNAFRSADSFDASKLGEGDHVIYVKAIGSVDANTIYLDSDAETFAIRVETLSAPSLEKASGSVTWASVEHASGYKASVDGGDEFLTTIGISDETKAGKHTVSVKAIGGVFEHLIYLDSAFATLEYIVEEVVE